MALRKRREIKMEFKVKMEKLRDREEQKGVGKREDKGER